ncbi:MAG: HAD family hydrolase [Thermocrispum sp.]
MTIRGVLFDFAGTLFSAEPDAGGLAGITDAQGRPLAPDDFGELVRRITSPITSFATFDGEFAHAWEHRDLDPELHRVAFVEAIRQAGVAVPEQAARLYAQMIDTAGWTPYPDAEDALRSLGERGIPVAVISNIGFDIRPAFTASGLDQHVKEYVLSFEHGVVKPDRRIFQLALDAIGVPAADAVMIGDSEEADGGSLALGMRFGLVPPARPADRPTALLDALTANGLH